MTVMKKWFFFNIVTDVINVKSKNTWNNIVMQWGKQINKKFVPSQLQMSTKCAAMISEMSISTC